MKISIKLALTMYALSCRGLQELDAIFRSVNPNTSFEVERARKWLRGVASPRDARLFDDWATVIKIEDGGCWIVSSSISDFSEKIIEKFRSR